MISRRETLRLGGTLLTGMFLSSCLPTLEETPTAPTETLPQNDVGISLEHELKGYYLKFDASKFLDISRRYGIQDENFRNFDIKITQKSLGVDSKIEDPTWVSLQIKEDGQGYIEIAAGTFIDQMKRTFGDNLDKRAQIGYLSTFTSYAIFVGYLDLGIKRGLFPKEWADQTGLNYLNNVLNAGEFLIVEVHPEDSSFPSNEGPIKIPDIAS